MSKYPGVIDTKVGYTGGQTSHPTYGQVCSGRTGHAEAVKVTFDPKKTSYKSLIVHFLTEHNPVITFGSDSKDQYRTAIFYLNDREKSLVAAAVAAYEKESSRKALVQVQPAEVFCLAEEYHQKYYQKNRAASCKAL